MKFAQKDGNIKIIHLSVKEKTTMPDPEIGKIYNAFDDGKLTRSRLLRWKIQSVIDLDNDQLDGEILCDLRWEIESCHWLYNNEQTKIYYAEAVDQNNNYDADIGDCFFIRTKDGRWFGVLSRGWDSALDVDGSLYQELLQYEQEG